MNLRPVSFKFKETGVSNIGLIAEEVVDYFPEIVPLDKEGKPYTVNYELLSVILLDVVKKFDTKLKIVDKQLEFNKRVLDILQVNSKLKDFV